MPYDDTGVVHIPPLIDVKTKEDFEDLVLDRLWRDGGNQDPGYMVAMNVFRRLLGSQKPRERTSSETPDNFNDERRIAKTRWYDLTEPFRTMPDIGVPVFALLESSVGGALPRVKLIRYDFNGSLAEEKFSWTLIRASHSWRRIQATDQTIPLPKHLTPICWRYPLEGEIG